MKCQTKVCQWLISHKINLGRNQKRKKKYYLLKSSLDVTKKYIHHHLIYGIDGCFCLVSPHKRGNTTIFQTEKIKLYQICGAFELQSSTRPYSGLIFCATWVASFQEVNPLASCKFRTRLLLSFKLEWCSLASWTSIFMVFFFSPKNLCILRSLISCQHYTLFGKWYISVLLFKLFLESK